MKKYRVNASEYTNLCSMYDKLKCKEIDMPEAPRGSYSDTDFAELEARISEIEDLMEVAYGVGALVEWKVLSRIREIKQERQLLRYHISIVCGASQKDANMAFEI